MELNIMELMRAYADDEFELSETVDTERVRALVWKKIGKPKRARRKYMLLIAAALLLSCAACAVAASTLSFGQFTPAMRTLLSLEAAKEVPASVEYECVTEMETARYADVNHEGRGELYVSAWVVGRSENILVVSLGVSTVTSEQSENMVWRAHEVGSDTYYILDKGGEWRDGGGYFQMAMPIEEADDRMLKMELCAGMEDENGTSYQIERVGVFSLEIFEWEEVLAYDFDPPLELYDETGKTILGRLTYAEWNSGRLLVEIEYNGEAPNTEEMQKQIVWANEIRPQLCGGMSVVFASGETLSLDYAHVQWCGNLCILSLELPPRLENEQPAALCVNGVEYALASAD